MILKVFINSLLIQKMKYQISSTGVGYRSFSITLILILPLINVFVLRAEETIKKIELKKTTAGLDICYGEKVIAEFSHSQTPQGRPFICNIHTLDGIKVTRNYPITDKDQDDHPHHQGLFHTFSQLNGIDFWHMKGMAKHRLLQHLRRMEILPRFLQRVFIWTEMEKPLYSKKQ